MRARIFLLFILWVVLGAVVDASYYSQGTKKDQTFNRHIFNFAPKSSSSKSEVQGCRRKPLENVTLLGPAKACFASKPIKLTKALKMGKDLCTKDWKICSITDKAVQQLSWKKVKMPEGCFAFNYGKTKAAGYGNHCEANLYFDGVLCCPVPGSKTHHHHVKASTLHGHKVHDQFADHRLNLIK